MFIRDQIESVVEDAVRAKINNNSSEPSRMPFHSRLFGSDRLATYSFLHSMSTNFGTAIFERIAKVIATDNFDTVETQYQIKGKFSSDAQSEITNIMNELSKSGNAKHDQEVERIRQVCQTGEVVEKRLRKVDVYLQSNDVRYLIDIKTAKPNVSGFEKYKQDMLEWVAASLYIQPELNLRVIVGIPYNPQSPLPYNRWTMRGMLDVRENSQTQLLVAQDFWNFLAGGDEIYDELLSCFENVGNRMRSEIDDAINSRSRR